jgi:hypothetical protein
MAYTINKTDGSILTTVPDGQVDSFSTGITLIGKNYSGFGEFLNENFVKILENSSNVSSPMNPVRGQLWYDTLNLKLNVYNGTEFVPVGSATVADSFPLSAGVGDLWYNNKDKQLYFFDGVNPILIGPDYSAGQGLSGLKVDSILDSLNQTRVITYLYNNGVLLGLFSNTEFTPSQVINGFSGDVFVGFNAGTLSGFKFNATATNSDSLGGMPALTYLRNDRSNITQGSLVLESNLGLEIGSAGRGLFQIQNNTNLTVTNSISNGRLLLNVNRSLVSETAVSINSIDRVVNIYQGFPNSELNVSGNLVVDGNLTINGATTTLNVDNLVIEDKTIELAVVSNSTDTTADGAGIIVKGSTDHSILWSNAGSSWNSTEHVNLVSGREFKINGVTVLSASSLGSGITSIPGVTNFGKQIQIKVGPGIAVDPPAMILENTRISTTADAATPNLELAPHTSGNISLINSPRITGLSNPVSSQDATTKEYVDGKVESKTLVFSMDISDGISNTGIAALLENLAPTADFRNGTLARILCTTITNSTTNLDINPLISLTKEVFNTPSGTDDAVTNVSISTATVSASTVLVNRVIKTFQISGSSWVFVS